MDQVLQGKRREWTPAMQTTAEVAAACGVSFTAIGRALNRDRTAICRRLIPSAAERARQSAKRWSAANVERCRVTYAAWYARNRQRSIATATEWRKVNRDRWLATRRHAHALNPSKAREDNRKWRAANKEKALGCQRRWYLANREKLLAAARARYAECPDKARVQAREWYARNIHRARASSLAWQRINPERARERNRRRRARARAGHQTALQPLTFAQRHQRFGLWSNRCAYCGSAGRMTVDHVLALTKGGLDEADNVAPACGRCNCSKHNSLVEGWYRRQPFFTEARWRKIQRHCPTATGQATIPLAAFAGPQSQQP
jgi:hypothetical protein